MRHLILLLLCCTTAAIADMQIPRTAQTWIVDANPESAPAPDIRADLRPPLPIPTGRGGWYDVVSGIFLAIAAFFSGRAAWRRRFHRSSPTQPQPHQDPPNSGGPFPR